MNKEEFNRLWAIRLANWLESKGFIKTAMLIILLFNPLALIIYLSLYPYFKYLKYIDFDLLIFTLIQNFK